MKVLIFNTLYAPNVHGGAERSVQRLAENLVRNGHKVTVCSTSNKTYTGTLNGVNLIYLKVHNLFWGQEINKYLKLTRILWHCIDSFNIFAARTIRNIIVDEKPDVIHTNNLAGLSVVIWRQANKLNVPVVHTLRDYYLTCPKSTRYNKGSICEQSCISCSFLSVPKRIQSRNVDVVVGISNRVLEIHRQLGFFTGIKSHIVPNSINIQNITSERSDLSLLRFGYLGRLSQEKGLEVLLNVFKQLDERIVKLNIGGDGAQEYVSKLKSKYEASNISFWGTVEPELFFDQVDCLVVPSQWEEPFGRVVIEALNFGKPVIVSDKGGLPEIIKEKDIGCVFKNPEELKRHMMRYVNDYTLYKQHCNNIPNQLVGYSDLDVTVKYISIFKELQRS